MLGSLENKPVDDTKKMMQDLYDQLDAINNTLDNVEDKISSKEDDSLEELGPLITELLSDE